MEKIKKDNVEGVKTPDIIFQIIINPYGSWKSKYKIHIKYR